MATILDAIKGISAYPIPLRTISETADKYNLKLTDNATQNVLRSKNYNLAKADILLWLSLAPDVSQGGQSFSLSDAQRTQLKNTAYGIYSDFGESQGVAKPIFGYKGSKL